MALFPDNPSEHDETPLGEPDAIPCVSGLSSACDNEGYRQVEGEWYCKPCFLQWENAAEAAHERMVENYYGASSPQTEQERYDAAVEQKRTLR